MPLIDPGTVVSNVRGVMKRPRPGPRGTVKPNKAAFNNFPKLAAAIPHVLELIVIDTTEDLGNQANLRAPVLRNPRRGDPAPGNLRRSKRTRYYKRKGTDLVRKGRVSWEARDPRGHRYAKPLETGSIRRTKRGLIRVRKGSGWLVQALQVVRPKFHARLAALEDMLPRE